MLLAFNLTVLECNDMKKLIKYSILLVFIALPVLSLASCKDDDSLPPWKWEDDNNNDNNGDNDDDDDDDDDDDPAKIIAKPRFIWIDASANFPDFANSKDNILRDLTLCKSAGFTDIVVDVRPNSGDVLFTTDVVDQVKWLGAWVSGLYSRIDRTATWDYLQEFIDAGHALGLKVHAGINVMVGGNLTSLGGEGMLFRDASKRSWATELLTESGTIRNIMDDAGKSAKFFNPLHEDVQEFLCRLLDDLASYPDLDGIILDRCRFDEIQSDFSNYSRTKFEDYLGQNVQNWPDDVMRAGFKTGENLNPMPVHFKKWLEFRVKVMHDFMAKGRERVKAKNPEMSFGVYVGGWYGSYYGVGVNWASKKYNTGSNYSAWATADYQKYGFADLMDVILIGAYASPLSIYGSSEWTVQGFCLLAKDKIKGDAPVVGGPDVGNGDWAVGGATINQAITQSVDAAINAGDGYFLFDMIHLKNKNQWQYVKEGIDNYLKSLEK